jgi:uncharacterized membrane-anchored protein YitT (DUF2179 family)
MTKTTKFPVSSLSFSYKATRMKQITDYIQIGMGALIIALSYVFFISPHKIIPGGVYGLSIIIHYKTAGIWESLPQGLPIGITALCFNIPLVLIALKLFGQSFLPRTIVTFLSTAIFVDSLTWISKHYAIGAVLEEDILLSCIYGSALLGLGVAMILRSKGTSAGTDVVAKMLTQYTHVPIGYTLIIIDSIVVILGLIAFGDWKIPLYSLFTVFVYGKAVDIFMQGLSFDKAVFIISDKNQLISERIIGDLHRGGTFFHGKGLYNGTEKEVIFTVINSRQVVTLREYIHQIDPSAFITILDAKEILGEGFHSIEDL